MSFLFARRAATALALEQPTCVVTSSMSLASMPSSSTSSESSSSTFGTGAAGPFASPSGAAANCCAAEACACAAEVLDLGLSEDNVGVRGWGLVDLWLGDHKKDVLALLYCDPEDARDELLPNFETAFLLFFSDLFCLAPPSLLLSSAPSRPGMSSSVEDSSPLPSDSTSSTLGIF
eukprot:CAMPEP_0170597158 /NCGR_PEP_ID=MMETSP0224-20130122/15554_1 /TAXON_ID=285029 /ORGANISM="Togula jolla, Strain CCCM 725" /LENGTH=175 /DNA_ID=CAMNT_0010921603 /DNA_START=85 /DNA_END=612 /DNA_ORIENTATION=-